MAMRGRGEGVRVAVVGAGVVGLTSATLLQEALPGASITVLADKFSPETVSDGAAGIFRPGLQFRGKEGQDAKKWIADSYAYYKKIIDSGEGEAAGVKEISGYHFSNKYPEIVWNALLKPILEEYRECTEEELNLYGYKYGTFMTTVLTECSIFLPYLTRKFSERGGKVEQRYLNSLEELAGQYDMVCNCSGFGAKELCGDVTVTPIRGQVFKVKAPWVKRFYYEDYDTIVVPGFNDVTLGVTRIFDSWRTEVDPHESRAIWERCVNMLPSLKNAEVLREWVGWRPYRPSVRVEKETVTLPGGTTLKVVHNYGHGGYGVLAAPGTSMEAVRMMLEMLRGHNQHHHHQAKL